MVYCIQRDLLEILKNRRLDITRIEFASGGSQAGRGGHGEVVVATLTLDADSPSGQQVAVKMFIITGDVDGEKIPRVTSYHLAEPNAELTLPQELRQRAAYP